MRQQLQLILAAGLLALALTAGSGAGPVAGATKVPTRPYRLFATTAIGTDFLIAEIDPFTGAVLNTFDAPVNQGVGDGLAFDGVNLFYLSGSWDPNTLYVLDPDDGSVRAALALTLQPGDQVDGLAYLGGHIYLLNRSATQQNLIVIDPQTGGEVNRLEIDDLNPGVPSIGGGLAAMASLPTLLVTTPLTRELLLIDPATGLIIDQFTHGIGGALGLAAVDGQIYLGMNTSNVLRIYAPDGTPAGSITVPGSIGVQSLGGDDLPDPCPEDIDDNGIVDIRDLQVVAGGIGGSDPNLDVNGDQQVSILDVVQVADHWQLHCDRGRSV